MAKDKQLSETLSFLTGGKIDRPETIPEQPTKQRDGNPQASKKENLSQHNFRMKDSEWKRLQRHFEEKGLSTAAGLRMILIEYMKKHGV